MEANRGNNTNNETLDIKNLNVQIGEGDRKYWFMARRDEENRDRALADIFTQTDKKTELLYWSLFYI